MLLTQEPVKLEMTQILVFHNLMSQVIDNIYY